MATTGISYRQGQIPSNYFCTKCKMQGVRLYREYQTMYTDLECTACAEESQKRKVDEHPHQIGWRVAAVPCEDGSGYWGFTSVPKDGADWWDRLPVSTLE